MTTYNLIRNTLAATICLGVLAACDGRGVTAMKARMYTAEERAQMKLADGQKTSPRKDGAVAGSGKTPAAPTSTGEIDPKINPNDHAEMKNYFEPANASGKADIKLAQLKQIVLGQLDGSINANAAARVLGITIEPVASTGKSVINLRAVVNLRDREQLLHFDNLVIDTAAKDLVSGTSNVVLKFKSPRLDDKVERITTDDLLVASVCLEAKGASCSHAYLLIQFGRKDGLVDVAVFELDENLTIVNSNIGVPPTSYDEALQDVKQDEPTATITPAQRAKIEAVNQDRSRHLVNQMMGQNDPFARAVVDSHDKNEKHEKLVGQFGRPRIVKATASAAQSATVEPAPATRPGVAAAASPVNPGPKAPAATNSTLRPGVAGAAATGASAPKESSDAPAPAKRPGIAGAASASTPVTPAAPAKRNWFGRKWDSITSGLSAAFNPPARILPSF